MATKRDHSLTEGKLIVILGPTAVGKSQLAIKLAKKFHGEIVSADSRQVYQGMDIGTGKVNLKEQQEIPHYLLDVASPRRHFDVVRYQKKAYQAIQTIIRHQHLPFLVGGSPFYLYAIIQGWQFPKAGSLPSLRKKLSQKSLGELQAILKSLDPFYFEKVEKLNSRRIIRAIEIATQLGHVPSRKNQPKFHTLLLGLQKSFPQIKELIQKRLEKRFRQGMLKEVENLHHQGISWKKLEDFGLEYRWISYYLQNKIAKEEMIESLQKAIEKFAKRQNTWFKKDPNIHWIHDEQEAISLVKNFLKEKS